MVLLLRWRVPPRRRQCQWRPRHAGRRRPAVAGRVVVGRPAAVGRPRRPARGAAWGHMPSPRPRLHGRLEFLAVLPHLALVILPRLRGQAVVEEVRRVDARHGPGRVDDPGLVRESDFW
jgi:hypothetical protein